MRAEGEGADLLTSLLLLRWFLQVKARRQCDTDLANQSANLLLGFFAEVCRTTFHSRVCSPSLLVLIVHDNFSLIGDRVSLIENLLKLLLGQKLGRHH